GLMAYIGAVMTLPGIAGFVLTMGIGVDSNVLIFERIKEELEAQRGVRAAVNAGFSRVFLTLIDTHLAALISAAFLIQFGTGPSQQQVLVRVPTVGAESGTSLSGPAQQVETALKAGGLGNFKIVGTEIVGPAVGADLRSKGFWATVLSLAGLLAYIAFRFQFSFAVGAVVASVHDLLITLAFLA